MNIEFIRKKILTPNPDCPWAEKMVLNPAMISAPDDPNTIYMLFRATGAWNEAKIDGKPAPYPIFLGFGMSCNSGKDWEFDFSRPAMSPRLEYDEKKFRIQSFRNGKMFDYANGCIEDPRLFYFENELYLSVACRAFPPGPYWEHDDPVQCMPEWALDKSKYPTSITENRTVTLLYKVNLTELKKRNYENAFEFIAPLHQGDISDDRDVVLFPRRLKINGRERIVCIHRPKEPWNYTVGRNCKAPSIFLALGNNFTDFYNGKAEEHLFAVPEYPWEANRIGASCAPVELENGKWLLPYHGKQDDIHGYTQSFMILEEQPEGLPAIISRPAERLFFAKEDWELEGDFTIPCVFTCSMLMQPNSKILFGYGAADRVVGIAECDSASLMKKILPSNTVEN